MKLEFLSKSLEYVGNEPFQTRVVLGNDMGAVYPVIFPSKAIEEDNETLFEQALEKVYQENFAERAVAESVQKVDEMDKLLARTRQEIAELKDEALAEMRAETERNREMLRIAFVTINSLLVGDEDDDEEELDDVEDSEGDLG